MRSPIIATLAVAAVLLVSVPAATAQEIHKDPSSRGTTGLFTVPLAAVLQPGQFSASVFYSAVAQQAGDSNIETLGVAGGFAFAAAEGLEIYGYFEPRVGIERDYLVQRTLVQPNSAAPRLDRHPFAVDGFSTGVGDLRIGAKWKVVGGAENYDGIAIIGEVKFPTSDNDSGIGTGKFDVMGAFVSSAEAGEVLGISSMVGFNLRAEADGFDIGNEFIYGVGVHAPTRFWFQGVFEATGIITEDPDPPSTASAPVIAGHDPVILRGGLRISTPMGVALDAGYNYNANFNLPDAHQNLNVRRGGWIAKLSFTNSRREPVVFVGASPTSLPPVNRPPTITCRAERTSVRQGESVRLFATVNDPDNDSVTVQWTAAAGSLSSREGETVTWSSQGVRPGQGPISARASDGYGGTADCELTVNVTAPPPPAQPTVLTFTCTEFPSGNTRIDNRCKAILDDVALQLRQNPRATAVITGHSDSTGSEEINTRMSQERADNAREYLVETHGLDATRIDTASAGSSEPIADNTTAEGRLQNRRIAVVVTIPPQ